MKLSATIVLCCSLGSSAGMLVGCSTGASRIGTGYDYSLRTLTSHVPHSIDDTFNAAKDALQSFELDVDIARKDAFEARLVGRGADRDRHTISLRNTGADITRIKITIEPVGDKDRSIMLLNEIEKRLK